MTSSEYEERPTWRIREDLRRQAEEVIRGRQRWEEDRGPSSKPLPKIEVDPRDLLQLLSEEEK